MFCVYIYCNVVGKTEFLSKFAINKLQLGSAFAFGNPSESFTSRDSLSDDLDDCACMIYNASPFVHPFAVPSSSRFRMSLNFPTPTSPAAHGLHATTGTGAPNGSDVPNGIPEAQGQGSPALGGQNHQQQQPQDSPMALGNGFADEDTDSEDGHSKPSDSTRFFHTILQMCSQGFASIDSAAYTPASRRAMLACQLGMDCIAALGTGEERDVVARVRRLSVGSLDLDQSSLPKVPPRPRRRFRPPLPVEILYRIFSYVRGPQGGYIHSRAVRTLFSCSLVARHWNPPANAALWQRIHMVDQPSRFGRFVLGAATSKYNKRDCGPLVRVLSVACTDADLSVLTVACHHTSELHSLELHRTSTPDAGSFRLLPRLRNRFPQLRSLIADMVHPSAWLDVMEVCRTCPQLQNLHISFATLDSQEPCQPLSAFDLTALFSAIPHLQSLSLWRVPLPSERGAVTSALASYCKDLRAIRLDDCGRDLSMDLVVDLWNACPRLECITLRMIQLPPTSNSATLLNPLPFLRTLLIDGCWLTDNLLSEMGEKAQALETLYVENDWRHDRNGGWVVRLTDLGFTTISAHLHNLKALSLVGLTGSTHISPSSIQTLLTHNPSITALNLARPAHAESFLTDTFLSSIAPYLSNIRTLELYMQTKLTEDALLDCLSHTPHLLTLGLSGCGQITDATLGMLPPLCPSLERLDMAGAVRCTTWGVQRLVDSAGRLRECVAPEVQGVRWGKVMCLDDPWSEEVFSPYGVWEREVRRIARVSGLVY
ncbi:hypothetical protein HK104_001914 [Borealophlyctis nickersoniae]|nr:hypothetical protein HK104_001914 [Borealophlyctis nickersoniae]